MRTSTRLLAVVALAVAVGLGTAVAPFASSSPDGLERVAVDEGFSSAATSHPLEEDAPAPGYAFPGIADERVATGVAGFLGTLAVFAATLGLGAALRRRSRGRSSPPTAPAAGT